MTRPAGTFPIAVFLLALFAASCGAVRDSNDASPGGDALVDEGPIPPPAGAIRLALGTAVEVAQVDPRFLSFAVDSSQVVGGHWWSAGEEATGPVGANSTTPFDFSRPVLRRLAAALAPAYLRIGGSEADVLWYDLGDTPVAVPPEPYELVLTRAQWDSLNGFASDVGLDVLFTLNAGPGPRDAQKRWQPDQARALIRYSRGKGFRVAGWELGNEINAYPLMHGLESGLSGEAYAADVAVARTLVDEEAPGTLLMGPSSAFWPLIGEANPVLPSFLATGGTLVDVVTWHYYPQQSRRCPVAIRPAAPEVMQDAANLDEVSVWARQVEDERDAHAPGTPVWLGETGNAQCGGEPGVSDSFAGTFWWLDQLGILARRGQPVVVRQTLSGSDYGLVRDEDLAPNPDYFASVLWKRLMGTRVLDVPATPLPSALRAYAHCAADGSGKGVVLLLHVGDAAPIDVAFDLDGDEGLDAYVLTAPGLSSRDVRLNDVPLAIAADGTLPALDPVLVHASWLRLPPRSCAFVSIRGVGVPACSTNAPPTGRIP
jgi:heparanase 1